VPTIITRGLGYDEPTIIYQRIGDKLIAHLVVKDTIVGTVAPEKVPKASVVSQVFQIQASIYLADEIGVVLVVSQQIHGTVIEEGPCMVNEDYQVRMFKGDDRTLEVTLSWPNGDPVDLTDAEIRFTVKEKTSITQANASIKKANEKAGGSNLQIKTINASGGRCDIYLVPVDTESMNPGTYYWDVELILASGKKITAIRSRITLKDDVTTSA
jgi:hypothetical protein